MHIMRKGPGLAQQVFDNVPIINDRAAIPAGSRHPQEQLPTMKDFQLSLIYLHPHRLADQPRRHRIGHFLDPDGAVLADQATQLVILAEPGRRQRTQHFELLRRVPFALCSTVMTNASYPSTLSKSL